MKHRKPNRIKASTSLSLAVAATAVTLFSTPANAAPADPGAVPAAPGQNGGTDESTVEPGGRNNTAPNDNGQNNNGGQNNGAQNNNGQPGVTTPGSPKPNDETPKSNDAAPKPDSESPKANENQPAGTDPKKVQPGVTVPRVAPLPVPGQNVQTGEQNQQAGQQNPAGQQNQQAGVQNPQTGTGQPGAGNGAPADPSVNTLTDEVVVEQQPRWQAPVLDSAPTAPVVEMTGPHSELGVSIDGGTLLGGWAANTHHFSNLDGYVGTIGYTTPGGVGAAGMSLDYTIANQIKVTAFATAGTDEDRKLEFILDTTLANALKADAENWIRLLPGGETILEAAGQIGKLPAGELPAQTSDFGGLTAQVGGSVQN
ncbi:hypothetical protein [Nocardia huaxiensis]|uniref:hypothetical protein n=1 Tax=Nocardia huaxiensis TaxID=2755382 RepID=UPI001FD2FF1B|nr:hypothetical protein [Nocardia huaxiensis]